MKNLTKKTKFRVTLLTIVFIISIVLCFSSGFSYVSQIIKNNNEIKALELNFNDKLVEEEMLEKEIERLKDPEYMARYTREKYYYSGKDELIIKIEE